MNLKEARHNHADQELLEARANKLPWLEWLGQAFHQVYENGMEIEHDDRSREGITVPKLRSLFKKGMSPEDAVIEVITALDRDNPERYGESVEPVATDEFDKFMDKILIQEGHNRAPQKQHDSPQRQRAARNQERPMGRVRYGGK